MSQPDIEFESIDILHLLSVCADVAAKASVILHNVVEDGGNKRFDLKTGPADVVTIADKQSEELIVGTLLKHFPKLNIVGEESAKPQGNAAFANSRSLESYRALLESKKVPSAYPVDALTVYVDPLDGTKEYTEGMYDAVTILIGIALRGTPLAGIVYEPWGGVDQKGHLVWGLVDVHHEGVNPKPCKPFEQLRICTTRSHNNPQVDGGIVKLGVSDDRVIRCGGAGRKVLMVARGEAECYLYPCKGTNKWDTCAPEALLRAANGVLTDKNGKNIDYTFGTAVQNLDGLIATSNAAHHSLVMHKLNDAKK